MYIYVYICVYASSLAASWRTCSAIIAVVQRYRLCIENLFLKLCTLPPALIFK